MTDRSYERVTQLYPAAAVLAPITVLVAVTFRGADPLDLLRSIVGVCAAAGFHLVAMRVVRDRGNAVQEGLWRRWGGKPTVQKMRWSSGSEAEIRRLHQQLRSFAGVKLPTPRLEASDLRAADQSYEQAGRVLRERTRDHSRYPRVWSELKQYGAARNLYGAKPAALLLAVVVCGVSGVLTYLGAIHSWTLDWWAPALSGAFAFLAIVAWSTIITERFVRTAADRYSDALLACVEA